MVPSMQHTHTHLHTHTHTHTLTAPDVIQTLPLSASTCSDTWTHTTSYSCDSFTNVLLHCLENKVQQVTSLHYSSWKEEAHLLTLQAVCRLIWIVYQSVINNPILLMQSERIDLHLTSISWFNLLISWMYELLCFSSISLKDGEKVLIRHVICHVMS